MRSPFPIILFAIATLVCRQAHAQNYIQSAVIFFTTVKNNELEKAMKEIKILANASPEVLKDQLDSENVAKAFWINIYNTFVQYLLKCDSRRYDDRRNFFTTPYITIAKQQLSLDDIEHGIIRHSRNKYSLGYLTSFFVNDFEKTFRLRTIDYRIHFALNCGAKSCPPVSLYKSGEIERQLDKATRLYLRSFASHNTAEDLLLAPSLCLWYQADFGGKAGVLDMMKKYGIVPPERDPAIEYDEYDWTLKLANYITL